MNADEECLYDIYERRRTTTKCAVYIPAGVLFLRRADLGALIYFEKIRVWAVRVASSLCLMPSSSQAAIMFLTHLCNMECPQISFRTFARMIICFCASTLSRARASVLPFAKGISLALKTEAEALQSRC